MSLSNPEWSLLGRVPGQSANDQVITLRATGAPEREIRAWQLGVQGEQIVGMTLSRLGPDWTVLHDVPVGTRGANIDHVLIGQSGVFTINTKHHPRADITINGDELIVRADRQDYAEKARYEGDRASKLLTDCTGKFVPVQPLLVFVNARTLDLKRSPRGVLVATNENLLELLESFSPTMFALEMDRVTDAAVQPETWAWTTSIDVGTDTQRVPTYTHEAPWPPVFPTRADGTSTPIQLSSGAWALRFVLVLGAVMLLALAVGLGLVAVASLPPATP